MKRNLTLFTSLILVLTYSLVFSACDDNVRRKGDWTVNPVSKTIIPGFNFENGADISYLIKYDPGFFSEIDDFIILDIYPVESLSFKGFKLSFGGIDVSGLMTYADDEGTVTFTLENTALLESNKEVVLRVTFTIVSVENEILNSAEVFVNKELAGSDSDLFRVMVL